MDNKLPFTPSKETLVFLLEDWLKSRPGLDWRDYGGGRDGWLALRYIIVMGRLSRTIR